MGARQQGNIMAKAETNRSFPDLNLSKEFLKANH